MVAPPKKIRSAATIANAITTPVTGASHQSRVSRGRVSAETAARFSGVPSPSDFGGQSSFIQDDGTPDALSSLNRRGRIGELAVFAHKPAQRRLNREHEAGYEAGYFVEPELAPIARHQVRGVEGIGSRPAALFLRLVDSTQEVLDVVGRADVSGAVQLIRARVPESVGFAGPEDDG